MQTLTIKAMTLESAQGLSYVSSRGQGPAEVGIAGRTYKLHPADPPLPTAAQA